MIDWKFGSSLDPRMENSSSNSSLLNSTIYHNLFPNFRTFILDIASFWNRKVGETLKVIQKSLKGHGTRLWSSYFYSNNWWKVKKGPLIISNLSNNCLPSIITNTTTCFRWVFEREFQVFLSKSTSQNPIGVGSSLSSAKEHSKSKGCWSCKHFSDELFR